MNNNNFPTHAPQPQEDGTLYAQIVANVLVAILAMGFGSLFGIGLHMHTQRQIQPYMRGINNNINRTHPYFIYTLVALHYIVSFPERSADYLRLTYSNLKQRIRDDYRKVAPTLPIMQEIARLNLTDLLENEAAFFPHLACPLSKGLLVDPVLTPAGITYNRCEIQDWYDRGYYTDPMTNAELTPQARKILIPNQNKVEQVLQFLQEEAHRRQQPPAATLDTELTINPATTSTIQSLVNTALHRRQQQVGRLFLTSYTKRQAAANPDNSNADPAVDPEMGADNYSNRTPLLQRNT